LDVIQTQVDELLPLKNKIDELRKRVKEITRAITDILNNDEDMALMYLSSPGEDDSVTVQSEIEEIASTLRPPPSSELPPLPTTPSGGAISGGSSSNKAVAPVVDTMSLEMLFENYLNEVEWIASEVEEIIDEITNTEEYVVLQLDLLRNRILRFELTLSISSFLVTCGALVTGLFGMNLLNHFETHPSVFYVVSGLMASGMIGSYIAFKRYGRKNKLF
jgi:magnesium transporter